MAQQVLALAQELLEIHRLIEDDDVTTTLSRFVGRLRQTVPDCEEAAISVVTDETPKILARNHRTAADDTEPSRAALTLQLSTPAGPLHEALRYGEPRRINDLAADHRWPAFGAAAINAGYRSCLFLPLPDSTSTPAAFSLFAAKPDAFASTTYDVVLLFALDTATASDTVTFYEDSTRLIEHLQTTLGNRALIGQAQAILMHRYDVTTDVALDLLGRHSRSTNVNLRTLSLDLVEAETAGRLPEALHAYGLAG